MEAGGRRPVAHARLHFDVEDRDERAKREIEAEAVAYVVGRYLGLDTSTSAFYLVAWQGEETGAIRDRFDRIRTVSEEFMETLER